MSDDLQTLLRDAQAALKQRNYDSALDLFKRVMAADPDNDEACVSMASVLAIRGLVAEVVDTYFTLSEIFERKGEHKMAVDVTEWILALKPENDKARLRQIAIHQARGDAAEVLRLSLSLARIYIELGRGDESIELLKTAQAVDPSNLDIGAELGEMYIRHGHIQDGAQQFRKIAHAYLAESMPEKAADAFKRLKLIQPGNIETLFTLGNLFTEMGRYVEAEAEFRAILKQDLNHLDALSSLGDVCQKKGQYRDAILAYNKILTINPQEIGPKEKLGDLYQSQGNHAEALKQYLAAAHAHQMVEDFDRAALMYRKVVRVDPTNPTACRELVNLGVSSEELAAELETIAKEQEAEARAAAVAAEAAAADAEARRAAAAARSEGLVSKGGGGSSGKMTLPKAGMAGPSTRPGAGLAMKEEGGRGRFGGGKPALGGKPSLGSGRPQLSKRQAAAGEEQAAAPEVEPEPAAAFAYSEEAPALPSVDAGVPVALDESPGVSPEVGPVEAWSEPVQYAEAPVEGEASVADALEPAVDASEVLDWGGEFASDLVPELPDAVTAAPAAIAEPQAAASEVAEAGVGGGLRGGGLRRRTPASEPAPVADEAPVAQVFDRGTGGVRRGLRGLRGSGVDGRAEQAEPAAEADAEATVSTELEVAAPVVAVDPEPAAVEQASDSMVPSSGPAEPAELELFEGAPDSTGAGWEAPSVATPAEPEVQAAEEPLSGEAPTEMSAAEEYLAPAGEDLQLESEPAPVAVADEAPEEQPAAAPALESAADELSVQEYLGAGDIRRALLSMRSALSATPSNYALQREVAILLTRSGMLEEAQAEWIGLVRAGYEPASSLRGLADCLLWSADAAGAQRLLQTLASVLAGQGGPTASIECLADAVAVAPTDISARFALADACTAGSLSGAALWHLRKAVSQGQAEQRLAEAVDGMRRIVALAEGSADRLALAELLERAGDSEGAVAEYARLAADSLRGERTSDALGFLRKIVSLTPRDIEARERLLALESQEGAPTPASLEELAVLHRATGNLQRSEQLYQMVLRASPDAYSVREAYVSLLLDLGQVGEARSESAPLLERCFREARTDEAVALLRRFISVQPQDVSLREQLIAFFERSNDVPAMVAERLAMASVYLAQGNQEEAQRNLQRAYSLDEDAPETMLSLARFYLEAGGDRAQGEALLRKVLVVQPSHGDAARLLVRLLLAQNRAVEALELLSGLAQVAPEVASLKDEITVEYKQRVAENPEDWAARYTLGVLYKEAGLLEPAIEQFQETRKVKELVLLSYNMLGCCFAQKRGLNQEELAIKQFRRGLETKGYPEQDYLELRYNLAELLDRRNDVAEATRLLEEIYAVDVQFRDTATRLAHLRGESSP